MFRDRLFFFTSYEGFRKRTGESERMVVETPEFRRWVIENHPGSVAVQLFQHYPAPSPTQSLRTAGQLNPKAVSLVDPALPPADLPVLGALDAFAPFASDNDQFSLRLDQVLNEGKDLLFGRYFVTDLRGTVRGAFGDDSDAANHSAGISHIHEFSPPLLNEARLGYLYLRTGFVPGSDPHISTILIDGPAGIQGAKGANVQFPGAFGSIFVVPQVFKRHTFQWQDIVSLQWRNHALRMGVDLRRLHENGNFGNRTRPFFVYQGIFDFANDAPLLLQAGVDPRDGTRTDTPRYWRSTEMGPFVQDDWKIHVRLTLNLGVRWDYFQPVTEKRGQLANIIFPEAGSYFERVAGARVGEVERLYRADRNNFAPRLGFAWDFLGDGRTVLRGGYGIAYHKLFFNIVGNARFNPPFFAQAQLSPLFGDSVRPFLGTDPQGPLGGFLGLRVPGVNLGFDERGGVRDTRVELRAFAGDRKENRLNPSFTSFNLRQNRVTSDYHGLNAQLIKRFSDVLSFQVAYTLGKSLDFGSDFFGTGANSGGLVGQSYRTYFQDPLNLAFRLRCPPAFCGQLPVGNPLPEGSAGNVGAGFGGMAAERHCSHSERTPLWGGQWSPFSGGRLQRRRAAWGPPGPTFLRQPVPRCAANQRVHPRGIPAFRFSHSGSRKERHARAQHLYRSRLLDRGPVAV